MFSLWSLAILSLTLPVLLHAASLTGGAEVPERMADAAAARGPLGVSVAPDGPSVGHKMADSLALAQAWPFLLSKESDVPDDTEEFKGVIGEYVDMLDSSERYTSEMWLGPLAPTDMEAATAKGGHFKPVTEPVLGDWPPASTQVWVGQYGQSPTNTRSTYGPPPNPTGSMDRASTLSPVLMPVGFSTDSPDMATSLALSTGPGSTWAEPFRTPNPPVTTARWGWTTEPSQGQLKGESGGPQGFTESLSFNTVTVKDVASDDEWQDFNETFPFLDCDEDPTATPCNVSDQSWSPIYPDDTTPNQSMRPFIAITPPLFVPLYSDWNSALATWGLAWEAHIYGLGSVFTVLGLISSICLLGLPLRCPLGSLYFTLLHLFLLAVGGMRAFSLLYDAYSHQERLPSLCSLLLSELPFPCLTSAFALAFLLLSLRSRVPLSLPRSLPNPLSALPRPCLLLGLSLLHFGVCLGSVGLLQLLPSLPALLLLPQGLFVGLSVLLSGSYLVFYFVARADTSHMYRLRDGGEGGGSPEGGRPARCPFAEADDWARAAGAGVGAALCLLGCGGLQLYGILHALGLGGDRGLGFQPWPWWGYQLGCRLCELGMCLALSLIGTQPLLCHCSSSPRTKPRPRPGSWSRLPCGSPTGGPNLPLQGTGKSPVLPPHCPWSLAQQEKLVVCEVITKGQSESLPLYSLVNPPRNGLQANPCQTSIPPLLSDPLSSLGRHKAGLDYQMSSLDSLGLDTDSTVDLRPPSPIDLSRSIDQALFSEALFPYGLFSHPRLLQASSSLSLNSPSHAPSLADSTLYRTSSCGDVDQEDPLSQTRPALPGRTTSGHSKSRPPSSSEPWGWRASNSGTLDQASLSGSSQGLCSSPRETGKTQPVPRASRGHNPPTQSSLPRAIPQRPHHRHYRTLSSASQDSQPGGRLAGTEELSDSRQLERDLAVQAEFINVCRQIDALSVCSDTIDL